MSVSIKQFTHNSWTDVYNRIIGSVVFLDNASAECLHWDGGLMNLLFGGAVGVKDLSPPVYCDVRSYTSQHRKAMFITQATSTQLRIISEIIQVNDFIHCILVSTVSLDIVYLELNEGKDVSDIITAGKAQSECTKMLECMLLKWIDKKNSAVEALHIPISTIALSDTIFLTPPLNRVFPVFGEKLIPQTPTVELCNMTVFERSQIRRLASSLNSMFEFMNLKEDVYYMGAYSSLVAGVLENSPVCLGRRKNCTNRASLILVDRTLDLCGVASHSMESLLDKIMSVLPRFPDHSTDVAVDMSPLCEANMTSLTEDVQLSPGCVYHGSQDPSSQTFENMIHKSQKEVMIELYHKLSSIDVQRSPGPKTLLKVTPQAIDKIVAACKGNYELIETHLLLLQQAVAVTQSLKSPQLVQAELISNLERQVLQNIATSRDSTSVLLQMSHLIKTRRDRALSLDRLLALLVHIYSLTGNEVTFNKQHEDALLESLSVAISEDDESLISSNFITSNIPYMNPEQCNTKAQQILSNLKEVARMRKILLRYKSVLKPCESGSGSEYRGVIQQLVEQLVDSRRPELPDLRHRHEGIKQLLRSGLSILTSQKQGPKHPLDNPTVIIYVIGGVSADECKNIHRTVITSGTDATVLIGSTKMTTQIEVMRDVVGSKIDKDPY